MCGDVQPSRGLWRRGTFLRDVRASSPLLILPPHRRGDENKKRLNILCKVIPCAKVLCTSKSCELTCEIAVGHFLIQVALIHSGHVPEVYLDAK